MIPFPYQAAGAGLAPAGDRIGYLDGLAVPPIAVLSLRRACSTANKAIRVRRSSDNAEQDVGFAAGSPFAALDTSALASFAGSDSCYVTTFYDQTGNGYNATQSTTTKQPRIVNAGVYDGKLIFDGSDDFMTIASLAMSTQYAGVYAKLKQANASAFKVMFEHGPDGQTTAGGFGQLVYNNNADWYGNAGNISGGRAHRFTGVTSLTVLTQTTLLVNRSATGTGQLRCWIADTEKSITANANNDQTGNFTTQDFNIAARNNGASLFADMWLETCAIYNGDTSGIRTSIQSLVS